MSEMDEASLTAHGRVMYHFKVNLSGLYDLIVEHQEDFHSLRIYNRGSSDILVVCKRFGSKGELEVNFGGGTDLASALLNASSGCENRAWRLDVPYDERTGK